MVRLQLLLDCSELESRLTETLTVVNTDDYGKDQLATQNLMSKHQVPRESSEGGSDRSLGNSTV